MENSFFNVLTKGGKRVFLIAEAGINHNGDENIAFRLVDEAKKAGADAIKFQTYRTEKRVSRDNPVYSILKQCELTDEQQKKIKEYADKIGIIFFSTPFDEESVDFLLSIKVPLFKVASFDIVHTKLLKKIATSALPVIISRGMAQKHEIDAALRILGSGSPDIALLHCVSAYPAPKEAVNLRIIKSLFSHYNYPIGFSDHTLDIDASLYAIAAGATIIEKHFTLDRKMDGPDQAMSVDPGGLSDLNRKIRELEVMLGNEEIRCLPEEQGAFIFRRPS